MPKCAKHGCEMQAEGKVLFRDPFHADLDTDWPVARCHNHIEEAKKFSDTDITGLKAWLER